LVTYHPAYLLRPPREKRRAWDDLKRLRQLLDTAPARPSAVGDGGLSET